MLAEKQNFLNYINTLDLSDIKELCYSLFLELNELKLQKSANDKIHTEMFLVYQKTLEEKETLKKELTNVKALLEKEIDKNNLRAKSTFGRKTEGFLSLIESADNKVNEFEDEAQIEESEAADVQHHSGVQSFSQNKADKQSISSGANSSKGKKSNVSRLTKSMQKLPHRVHYAIDVAVLNEKYGEGNWRIAFWHKHEKLEKLDTPYYVDTTMTPCISIGLEHNLVKANKANVLIYLRYLLEEMPKHKNASDRGYMSTMTPWSEEYKSYEQKHIEENQMLCQSLFPEPECPKHHGKGSIKVASINKSA